MWRGPVRKHRDSGDRGAASVPMGTLQWSILWAQRRRAERRPKDRCRDVRALRRWGSFETPAGQRPPLSCRTSPPLGGRSDVTEAFANRQRRRIERSAAAANLPPCGGDVRQDRGGREGSQPISPCAAAFLVEATAGQDRGSAPSRFAPCFVPGWPAHPSYRLSAAANHSFANPRSISLARRAENALASAGLSPSSTRASS